MASRTYKFRIYPTKEQEELLEKGIKLNKLYWDLVVDAKEANNNYFIKPYKETFAELKPELLEQCKDIDDCAMINTWYQLLKEFCIPGEHPRPVNIYSQKFKLENMKKHIIFIIKPKFVDGKLLITKNLGPIKGTFPRCEFIYKSIAISKTLTGEWYVSFLTSIKDEPRTGNNREKIRIKYIGKDNVFITLSDGTKIEYPDFIKDKEKRLVHYKRLMDRKFVKGAKTQSQNYYKAKLKVDKVREKIYRQKKDWLHKLSAELTDKYQFIFDEDTDTFVKYNNDVKDDFGVFKNMLSYKGFSKRQL